MALAIALLWCLAVARPILADDPSVTATFGSGINIYPPYRWTDVRITLHNPTDADINGSVHSTVDAGAEPFDVVRAVHVPARSSVRVDLLSALGTQQAARDNQPRPPTAIVYWKNAGGATIAQTILQGMADSGDIFTRRASTDMPGALACAVYDTLSDDPADDTTALPQLLQPEVDYIVTGTMQNVDDFPRRAAALDAVRLVVLYGNAADRLDPAQRQALLDHVRSGATLLIETNTQANASWLGEYLPLRFIESRYATEINTSRHGTLRYAMPATRSVCELAEGAVAIESDITGPLAAYRSVGLGRVAALAYPFGVFTTQDTAATRLLADAVGIRSIAFHDPSLNAPPPAVAVLPLMIGQPAPPWTAAAIIAGAYTTGVTILLLFSGARYRPMAFAVSIGLGVLLAGGIVAWTNTRTREQPLLAARLTQIVVTPDTLVRDELITFYGKNRHDLGFHGPEMLIRPVTGSDGATLHEFPLRMEGLTSSSGRLESVWNVRTLDPQPNLATANVTFDAGGAWLNIESRLHAPLENARLIVAGRAAALPPLPPGAATYRPSTAGLPGDLTIGGNVIADERGALHDRIVTQAYALRENETPRQRGRELSIVGFLNTPPAGGVILSGAAQNVDQTLVRIPTPIRPAAPGQSIAVPAGFVRIERGPSSSLPISQSQDTFNESNLNGAWTFAIAAHQDIGKLTPTRVNLDVDLTAIGWTIILRAGQCANGKVRENPTAPALATWNGVTGRQRFTLEVGPGDIDSNGWVWFNIHAEPRDSMAAELTGNASRSSWQILRFDAVIEGRIDGPPIVPQPTWTSPAGPARSAPPETKP